MPMEDARKKPSSSAKGKKEAGLRWSKFYTYHPSDAHRKAIEDRGYSLDDVLDVILTRVENGLVFTWRHKNAEGVYVANIRTDNPDFRDNVNLSIWHSDPLRAAIAMVYYLTEVNPDWPETYPGGAQTDYNW